MHLGGYMLYRFRIITVVMLFCVLLMLLVGEAPLFIFNLQGRKIILLFSTGLVIVLLGAIMFNIHRTKFFNRAIHAITIFFLAFNALLVTNKFMFAITKVNGESMAPNLHTNSFLVVGYNFEPTRFDVVVINSKGLLSVDYIVKRIVGLPGEKVDIIDNLIYINDQLVYTPFDYYGKYTEDFSVTIPEGQYLVLGDNRSSSLDGRSFGLLEKDRFVGKVLISR